MPQIQTTKTREDDPDLSIPEILELMQGYDEEDTERPFLNANAYYL